MVIVPNHTCSNQMTCLGVDAWISLSDTVGSREGCSREAGKAGVGLIEAGEFDGIVEHRRVERGDSDEQCWAWAEQSQGAARRGKASNPL